MPAQLLSLDDGMRILLDKPILLLGRDTECDIQFESKKISRRHCCIAQVGERLIVRDLGSTNGIRINGVRVVEGFLKDGDELSVGSHRYQVSSDAIAGQHRDRGQQRTQRAGIARAPVEEMDDSFLESLDEPIPISDRANSKQQRNSKSGSKRRSRPPESESRTATPDGPIIPDRIELLPSSDLAMPSPPQNEPAP